MTASETLKLIAKQWCNLSDLMKLAGVGRNNALVIKSTIKSIDLESYKGKLYNQYTALQIESTVNNSLKELKGVLFKEYIINKIGFKKTEIAAGAIIIDFSIVPYGTLESLNIIMGV